MIWGFVLLFNLISLKYNQPIINNTLSPSLGNFPDVPITKEQIKLQQKYIKESMTRKHITCWWPVPGATDSNSDRDILIDVERNVKLFEAWHTSTVCDGLDLCMYEFVGMDHITYDVDSRFCIATDEVKPQLKKTQFEVKNMDVCHQMKHHPENGIINHMAGDHFGCIPPASMFAQQSGAHCCEYEFNECAFWSMAECKTVTVRGEKRK